MMILSRLVLPRAEASDIDHVVVGSFGATRPYELRDHEDNMDQGISGLT